jgi:predicted permease
MARGMTSSFGNVIAPMRAMLPSLDGFSADVITAMRGLRRTPGITATVLLVLGAAIGLNATLFTVVAGIAWRPWGGITHPDTLVRVYARDPSGQVTGLSLADASSLARKTAGLQGVAAMRGDAVEIERSGSRQTARALLVTGNLFDLLGVVPTLGRPIVADDDLPGKPRPVTMLAYSMWQQRFGGDPAVVGSALKVNGVLLTIVGIVSPDFESAEPTYDIDLYLPTGAATLIKPGDIEAKRMLSDPRACCADVVGRVRAGVPRDQLAAELSVRAREWTAASGLPARGALVTDTAFASQPGRLDSPQVVVTLSMLGGGLVLVWLIACANIGNLMLARTLARLREVGTRSALGATRGRIVRLLLTEGVVLGVGAAIVGAAIASRLPLVLFHLVASTQTRAQFPFPVAPDLSVLAYVIGIGLVSAIVFALAPALLVTRLAVRRTIVRDGHAHSHRLGLRSVFLGAQIAVSVVLLASAGLLARGAVRGATSFNPGFRVHDVTAVSFTLPERTYDRAKTTALLEAIDHGLGERGIDHAFASRDPFSLYREGTVIRGPGESNDRLREVMYLDVSSNYLSLLEIPVHAGRGFTAGDTDRPAVVINDAMAAAFWPGIDPVGQTFVMRRRGPAGEFVQQEIVGVARNVSVSANANVRPMFYRPVTPGANVLDFISQDPRASQAPVLLVRGEPRISSAIATVTSGLDSRIVVSARSLADALDNVRASMKWGPILAGALGVFAVLLATVGMFGVFAYAVQQRTREIGIRMALGAPPAAVVRLIVAGHSRAVAVGSLVGLLGAVGASLGLRARLFGLSPLDPFTYAGVLLILASCGLVATYAPVRRATRISPVVALRAD